MCHFLLEELPFRDKVGSVHTRANNFFSCIRSDPNSDALSTLIQEKNRYICISTDPYIAKTVVIIVGDKLPVWKRRMKNRDAIAFLNTSFN